MTGDEARLSAARPRLLKVIASLLEALYDPASVAVLATLHPADMRPGGARVPGTSYELQVATAAGAMSALLAVRGMRAEALLLALAEADRQARYAVLAGKSAPTLETLYSFCTPDIAGEELEQALQALGSAAEKLFTPTQARRIAALCQQVRERPARLDAIPVQQFIAELVRNAP